MKNLCHNCEKPSSAPICKDCVREQQRIEDALREEREGLEFDMEYGRDEWDDWNEMVDPSYAQEQQFDLSDRWYS